MNDKINYEVLMEATFWTDKHAYNKMAFTFLSLVFIINLWK